MKKLFIGLLVVAVGTGVFFLLRRKKDETVTKEITKEWILGRWTTGAATATDPGLSKYQLDFQKDGRVIRSKNDSTRADTSHYAWNKTNEMVWKEKATDSTGNILLVTKLTPDSLQVQAADSSATLFIKVR